MEMPDSSILKAESILKDLGFHRIYRWKINKRNFLIQICPNNKHVCILTTNLVRRIMHQDYKCDECVGNPIRGLEHRVHIISQHKHLIFKLFQLIDHTAFKNTKLWNIIETNMSCIYLFDEYKKSQDKHCLSNSNNDSLSDSYDFSSDSSYISHLMKSNQSYVSIITQLDITNSKLRSEISYLNETISEQELILDKIHQFLNLHGLQKEFKNFVT